MTSTLAHVMHMDDPIFYFSNVVIPTLQPQPTHYPHPLCSGEHVQELLQKQPLTALLEKDGQLVQEVKKLDSEMKTLVRLFVRCL